MKRWIFLVLVFVLMLQSSPAFAALAGEEDVAPPPELKKIMPDSVLDLSTIGSEGCAYGKMQNYYDYRKYISSANRWISIRILYQPGFPSATMDQVEKKVKTQVDMQSDWRKHTKRRDTVSGYPVAYFFAEDGYLSMVTLKDKHTLYVDTASPVSSDKSESGARKYAEAAMSYMLSRITDGGTAPAAPTIQPPSTEAGKPQEPSMLELKKHQQEIRRKADELEYRYSEQYKKDQEAKRENLAQKEETERQQTQSRYDVEDTFAQALNETDELQKHAKNGESYEKLKPGVVYCGSEYTLVKYSKGGIANGYLWIDPQNQIVKDQKTIRALFSYFYVFGLGNYSEMKEEAAKFKEDAQKCDQEIKDYAFYKDAAKTLKLASNAMSVYLSGGAAVGTALSAMDVGLFLKKIELLENAGKTIPDFDTYEDLSGHAQDLSALDDLATAISSARKIQKLTTELQAMKNLEKIKSTKTSMDAAKASMLSAVTSLGWTVFDAAEGTGQIAEQAAVLSIKYAALKEIDLIIAKIIKDAVNGMDDDTEARNIFVLSKLKAKQYKLKGDLAATLLEAYKERKNSISGYIGRFSLYVQGKAVDEQKARQAIYDLEYLVDLELDKYYETKINTAVSASLAIQRAAF